MLVGDKLGDLLGLEVGVQRLGREVPAPAAALDAAPRRLDEAGPRMLKTKGGSFFNQ